MQLRRVLVLALLALVALAFVASASAMEVEAEAELAAEAELDMQLDAAVDAQMEMEAATEVEMEADAAAETGVALSLEELSDLGLESGDEVFPAFAEVDAETGVTGPFKWYKGKNGKPKKGKGDLWQFYSAGMVTNMWGGVTIGNVAPGSYVQIEHYIYHKSVVGGQVTEEAVYGWGSQKTGPWRFSGWVSGTSCGWYTLQRMFRGAPTHAAVLKKSGYSKSAKCPYYGNNGGPLKLKSFQDPSAFVKSVGGQGSAVNMKAKQACTLYMNFDKRKGHFGSPVGTLAAGMWAGRRYKVKHQNAAMIHSFNPAQKGWYFVKNSCLVKV